MANDRNKGSLESDRPTATTKGSFGYDWGRPTIVKKRWPDFHRPTIAKKDRRVPIGQLSQKNDLWNPIGIRLANDRKKEEYWISIGQRWQRKTILGFRSGNDRKIKKSSSLGRPTIRKKGNLIPIGRRSQKRYLGIRSANHRKKGIVGLQSANDRKTRSLDSDRPKRT